MKPNKTSYKKLKRSKKYPKISVIIPTLNSWFTLRDCLDSIQEQTIRVREIVIVDNASVKKTFLKIKSLKNNKRYKNLRIIRNKKNLGVTGARNVGINVACENSDYLFFVDHDMIAKENTLEELLKVAEGSKEVGIVTPKIYYWEDRGRIWAAGTNINLWTGQVLFRGGKDEGQYEKVEEVQVAPACSLVKRAVIDAIHGFDDKYFATYEDTDFCFRAKKKGFKTLYVPKAIAYHQISPNPSDERKRLLARGFWVGRNRILFMGDFGNNFFTFLLFTPIYYLYFVRMALEERDLTGLINYSRGYLAGIIEELFGKRILIHIPYSVVNSYLKAIGGNVITVLDVGCGNGRFMEILNKNKQWSVTGIDIYEPDVVKASETGKYAKVILGDIRKLDKFFKKEKYDLAFCASVLEHLNKKEALELIKDMEKLARKVLISVPRGFLEKHGPYYFEGDNPYQEHKSAWSISEFEDKAYEVHGIGVNFLLGEKRLSKKKFWWRFKILFPVRTCIVFLEYILAYILSPISFYYPGISTGILAVKDTK